MRLFVLADTEPSWTCFSDAIEANRVLIHGHTYLDSPLRSYGSTRIEYVYGARVVTV